VQIEILRIRTIALTHRVWLESFFNQGTRIPSFKLEEIKNISFRMS